MKVFPLMSIDTGNFFTGARPRKSAAPQGVIMTRYIVSTITGMISARPLAIMSNLLQHASGARISRTDSPAV